MIEVRDAHGWNGSERRECTANEHKKPLNIGLVGYGFMGRTHSNAYRRSTTSSTSTTSPVLKAVCGARRRQGARRSPTSGATSRSRPTGGSSSSARTSTRSTSARPNNTHAEIAIAAAAGRQDDPVREAARDERGRGRGDGRGGREGRRAEHGLVQLPPRPGRHARQAAHRRGPARQDLPLPRQVPAGLDDLAPTCRRAARASGGSTSPRPAAASPATCSPTASTPRSGSTAPIDTRHRDDRDVRQGAQAQPDRQGRDGRHRRRLRLPLPLRQRLARHSSNRPATPAATRRSTRFEINGENASHHVGPARPAPPAVLRPPRRGHAPRLALASTSPTATTPT